MRPLPRTTIVAVALAAGVSGAAGAAGAQRLTTTDVFKLPFDPPTARVPYGSDSLQVGELRLPPGRGPFPVAVLIHGGCWSPRFRLSFQNSMATALAKAGVATWNVEYRLPTDPGGGWPNTFRDVADAIDYVRVLARTYALDTTRVVVAGHSVGSYLAAWAGARGSLPAGSPLSGAHPLPLRGVVLLDGVPEPKFYDFGQSGGAVCGRPVLRDLLGAAPDSAPERLRQITPTALVPQHGPIVVLYQEGGRFSDAARPADTARVRWNTIDDYVAAARRGGDVVDVTRLGPVGHFEFVAPGSVAWGAVEGAILHLAGVRPH